MGLVDRLKERLSRTRGALADGVTGILRGGRPMDEALFAELEELLWTADLGPVAGEVVADLARAHKRGSVRNEAEVRAALRESLLARLPPAARDPDFERETSVLLVVGVNGSGKTTTIAKLASRWHGQGQQVLVGACDTWRAAAADQLELWAARSGVEIVRKDEGADPAAVAFEALEAADVLGYRVVILDTAGRLHTQKHLMAELDKIKRVVSKRIADAPHEVWLVLDGTNGQNAIQQARLFTASVAVTGLVIAKLDGTARGGAVFGITHELGLPIRYIGTGEGKEDLELFDPRAFVDAVLGGDGAA